MLLAVLNLSEFLNVERLRERTERK
jgi:hypothetical protein